MKYECGWVVKLHATSAECIDTKEIGRQAPFTSLLIVSKQKPQKWSWIQASQELEKKELKLGIH